MKTSRAAAALVAAISVGGCSTSGGPIVTIWSSPGALVVVDDLVVQKLLGAGCKSSTGLDSQGDGSAGGGGSATARDVEAGTAGTFAGALATDDDCTGILQAGDTGESQEGGDFEGTSPAE